MWVKLNFDRVNIPDTGNGQFSKNPIFIQGFGGANNRQQIGNMSFKDVTVSDRFKRDMWGFSACCSKMPVAKPSISSPLMSPILRPNISKKVSLLQLISLLLKSLATRMRGKETYSSAISL
jgi:hypothetical protein